MIRLRKKTNPKPIKNTLVHLFKGNDGHDYFTFAQNSELPLQRFTEQMKFQEHLRAGLTGEEMNNILDQIDQDNAELLKAKDRDRPKISARISTWTTLARSRMSGYLHHDLVLNMAATWIVRADEDPITINPQIHAEKVKFFDAECREGSAWHFFQKTGFAGLPHFMKLSEEELTQLWMQSMENQKILADMFERLTRERLHRASLKISKSN